MEFIAELWLPIVVSAAFVFVVSSVIHMALPIHKSDHKKLDGEDAVRDALRAQGNPAGQYMFPSADSMKECGTPEMQAKFNEGPVGIMTILPNGTPAMGGMLLQWFAFSLVISTFAAYVAWFALGPGGAEAFRLTGTVAVLGYSTSSVHNSIWKGLSWGITFKFVIDGLIYGLTTGATFAWLWPAVA